MADRQDWALLVAVSKGELGSPRHGALARAGWVDDFEDEFHYFAMADRQDWALLVAVSKGELGRVRELLAQGHDVNFSEPGIGGAFPLAAAAQVGDARIVSALLEAGARPDQRLTNGRTALVIASAYDKPEVAALLVQAGTPVATDPSPLVFAAEGGCEAVMRVLLGAPGVDVNEGGPLLAAIEKRNLGVAHMLLQAPGIAVDSALLLPAAGAGDVGVFNHILQAVGAEVAAEVGADMLRAAVRSGVLAVVERALSVADGLVTPGLLSCAPSFALDVVRRLLQVPGIDVNTGSPLAAALRRGQVELSLLLLAAPGVVATPHLLGACVESGDLELVQAALALDEPRDPIEMKEAVSQAARQGDVELIGALLAAGASAEGALVESAACGDLDSVRELLSACPNPPTPQELEEPLYTALLCDRNDSPGVVAALLEEGADAEAAKARGRAERCLSDVEQGLAGKRARPVPRLLARLQWVDEGGEDWAATHLALGGAYASLDTVQDLETGQEHFQQARKVFRRVSGGLDRNADLTHAMRRAAFRRSQLLHPQTS